VDGQYGSTYCISFLHTHLLPSILLCGVPATLKAGVAGEGYHVIITANIHVNRTA